MPKSLIKTEKKSAEDEQTSAELSSAHRRLQAKCRQVQTSYIKRIKISLACHIIHILLTEKKSAESDEQTSAELSSAHRRLQAKCRQVQTQLH